MLHPGPIGMVDWTGIGFAISALAALISAIGAQYLAIRGLRRTVDASHTVVQAIEDKVDTLNESTIGELANEAETRRIEAIPFEDRTEREHRHQGTECG